jgi:hypothetical protein
VLVLALALPFGASAQWYLFPGGRGTKDTVNVRTVPDTVVVKARPDSTLAPGDSSFVFRDSTLAGSSFAYRDSIWVYRDSVWRLEPVVEEVSIPVTRVTLVLPFKSAGTPNSNFLEFYCGALLAADGLCSDEHLLELSVFDSTVGLPSAERLDSSDLIIGPVNLDEVERMLPRLHGNYMVSPLDPKVAVMTDRFNVIQAPAGWEAQADELVRWIGEDLRGGDQVVLLQSATEAGGEIATRLATTMGERGIAYSISSSPEDWEDKVRGTCRFVIASENDEFCSASIREIALMNIRGGHNMVYSTSRLRSISDLETESLHAAAARITASYYADPGNIMVRNFAENYRSLFKGEPGQWAYQGYDLMNYFGSLAVKNPDLWQEELAATPGTGLQTDFSFDQTGKNNTAVRRLKYNANNTITIIR